MESSRQIDLFFEIQADLPRQGPGCFQSTSDAFTMMTELPEEPVILDMGCGPGAQTMDLCRLSPCRITAVDTHQPFLNELKNRASQCGFSHRITTLNQCMSNPNVPDHHFDVVWAEGSIYIIGFENGLRKWKRYLKPGGYVGVTEATWLKPDPPEEIKHFWRNAYPEMQTIKGNRIRMKQAGYREIGSFVVPENAWWEPYYTPLRDNITRLRNKYRDDVEAMEMLEEAFEEITMYEQYSSWYGYVFYVIRHIAA
jgi:ubiquinone/menaquinone biosynthesis C-methylase UbiE